MSARSITTDDAAGPSVEADQPKAVTPIHTWTELHERSQSFGDVTMDFTGLITEDTQEIPEKVYDLLQGWLLERDSRTLWICGPAYTTTPSDLSSAAAYVVDMIPRSGQSLIAHRCQTSGSAAEALVSMVYSVIAQLIQRVPERFSTHKDLSQNRFDLLDRSIGSLALALGLMEDLLTLIPEPLNVVLDGLQLCEWGWRDKRYNKKCKKYLGIFIRILNDAKKSRVLKVLFTTDGPCAKLRKRLDPEEQEGVEDEMGEAAWLLDLRKVEMTRLKMEESREQ